MAINSTVKSTKMNLKRKISIIKHLSLLYLWFIVGLNADAQNFEYSVRMAFAKFDIDYVDNGANLFPENYYPGYEIGAMVSYNPNQTPFRFYSGISYSRLNYEYYSLNYFTIPLKLSFVLESGFA